MASKSSKGKKGTQRKLTAILSADVVGYSRLMGADEEATLKTLTAYRKVFTSYIPKFRGRVVDAKGDALLAEFAAVTDAVSCAVEIQRELAERNLKLTDSRRMEFRIGINLGEVMMKGEEIYGDGVNIAARLESLAEPGGICISRGAYDQVESKLNLECEYLGEQQVKNIAKPVRAYKVFFDATRTPVEAAASGSPAPTAPDAKTKGHAKPGIAVLPFKNLSGDPEQEYFSDGITEDLITDLSKISRLSVTSQNTAFTYKGRAVNVKQVAQELGVDYVLEGSVRKVGNRVRITAQLIDAVPDRHLWSERYDRELNDIFALQDEITLNIVTALDVQLLDGEQVLLWRKSTRNAEAYEAFLKGRNVWQSTMNREGSLQSTRLFEQAVKLDPEFARAYAALAFGHQIAARNGWSQSREQSLKLGMEFSKKAVALDDSLAYAHAATSHCHAVMGQYEEALREGERAVALNPQDADVLVHLARTQIYAGKAEQAVINTRKAMRMTPGYPTWYPIVLGMGLCMFGNYEEAVTPLQESLQRAPDAEWANIFLTAAYAALDRHQDAEAQAREVLRVQPDYSVEEWASNMRFKNPQDSERMTEFLRKAGLPD